MNRRMFASTLGSAGALFSQSRNVKTAIFELRYYRMRNGAQTQRTSDFLSKHFMPAAQRAGMGPLGFFGPVIAEQSPFVLSLASYPTFAAVEQAMGKMTADKDLQKA